MKCLTVYQPYASLIALQKKKYETRSWPTKYRGPILIHAGKSEKYLMQGITHAEPFRSALEKLWVPQTTKDPDVTIKMINWNLGCIIAVADLVDCLRIVYHPGTDVDISKRCIEIGAESMTENKHDPDFGKYIVPTEQELAFGDWMPGRYAWELENVKVWTPIPAKGKQRIWNWMPEAEV